MLAAGSLALLAATESLPGLPAPAQYGILGVAVAVLASGKVLVPVGILRDERATSASRLAQAQESAAQAIQANMAASMLALDVANQRALEARERADRNEDRLNKAHDVLATEMTPAMIATAAALDRSNDLWRKMMEGNLKQIGSQ